MNDTCTIAKTEFIRVLNGASAFTMLVDGLLNPGDSSFFPWLSGVAPNWERYRFNELIFSYKSTSSDSIGGSNPQIGTINFVFNGDSEDTAPPTYQVFKNYAGNRSAKLSEHMIFPIRGASSNQDGWLFVAPQPQIDDLSDYYLGRLNIAVQGAQTTGVIGELYVSYSVTFAKSKLSTGIGAQLGYFVQATTETRAAESADYTNSSVVYTGTNMGVTYNSTTKVYTFPSGSDNAYWAVLQFNGATGTSNQFPNTLALVTTNITMYNGIGSSTSLVDNLRAPTNATIGTNAQHQMITFTFKVTDPGLPATLKIVGGAVIPITGACTARLTIGEINPFMALQ